MVRGESIIDSGAAVRRRRQALRIDEEDVEDVAILLDRDWLCVHPQALRVGGCSLVSGTRRLNEALQSRRLVDFEGVWDFEQLVEKVRLAATTLAKDRDHRHFV